MLILIVHSFDLDQRSDKRAYQGHLRQINELFFECGETDMHFVERAFDQLGDLVLDWEYDQLHFTAQQHCIAFDRLDMIFVIGNLCILPWDPRATQVVSLIHMAKFVGKPLAGVGFGAFAAVYAFCTKGKRFNILNGPYGDSIHQLAAFPRYSVGSGAFPSGWLDRDTGDVYTYDKRNGLWRPVCNIGMHCASRPQTAVLDTSTTLPPYLTYREDYDKLAPSHTIAAIEDTDTVALLCRSARGHPLVKGLSMPASSPHFVAKSFGSWRLNRVGAFPAADEGLLLLAEGKPGPMVLGKRNNRLLLIALRPDVSNRPMRDLLAGFTRMTLDQHRAAKGQRIDICLHDFIFGVVAMGEGDYDTTANRDKSRIMAPPLAKQPVPTSLDPHGPIKVDPPVLEMFARPPPREQTARLVATRRSSSVGRKPHLTVQNPLSARQKRLETALKEIGFSDQQGVIARVLQQSAKDDPFAMAQHMPDANLDLLAGRAMNDNSITTRRHNQQQQQQQYQAIFSKSPPSPRAADLSLDEDHHQQQQQQNARPLGTAADSPIPSPPSLPSPSPPMQPALLHAAAAKAKEQKNDNDDNGDGSGGLDPTTANRILSGTLAVPKIEHWVRVFSLPQQQLKQPDGRRSESPASKPASAGGDQHSKTATATTTMMMSPAPPMEVAPFRAKQGSSRRSKRGVFLLHTPRTAQAVMAERMACFMPVSHPEPALAAEERAREREREREQSLRNGNSLQEESLSARQSSPTHDQLFHPSISSWAMDEEESTVDEEEEMHDEGPGIVQVVTPRSPRAEAAMRYRAMTRRFQAMDKKAAATYVGQFTAPFLSQSETLIKQETEARMTALAGEFRLHFSKADSAMKLGEEGGIRPHGPFPVHPGFALPKGTTAQDWIFMESRPHPEKWVGAGNWQK